MLRIRPQVSSADEVATLCTVLGCLQSYVYLFLQLSTLRSTLLVLFGAHFSRETSFGCPAQRSSLLCFGAHLLSVLRLIVVHIPTLRLTLLLCFGADFLRFQLHLLLACSCVNSERTFVSLSVRSEVISTAPLKGPCSLAWKLLPHSTCSLICMR